MTVCLSMVKVPGVVESQNPLAPSSILTEWAAYQEVQGLGSVKNMSCNLSCSLMQEQCLLLTKNLLQLIQLYLSS